MADLESKTNIPLPEVHLQVDEDEYSFYVEVPVPVRLYSLILLERRIFSATTTITSYRARVLKSDFGFFSLLCLNETVLPCENKTYGSIQSSFKRDSVSGDWENFSIVSSHKKYSSGSYEKIALDMLLKKTEELRQQGFQAEHQQP